jgi:hypothetical protein
MNKAKQCIWWCAGFAADTLLASAAHAEQAACYVIANANR